MGRKVYQLFDGSEAITLFYSYASEDEALCDALRVHLIQLQREKRIRGWHRRQILAGMDWSENIDRAINSANLILLLISPDFLASDYCYQIEVRKALERHTRGDAIVVPIILRPCDWKSAPFAHLQVLPRNEKAITTWGNQDEALLETAHNLRQIVDLYFGFKGQNSIRPAHLHPNNQISTQRDLGEAPHIEHLYGRAKEEKKLRSWITDQRCRAIMVSGMGGIGKTALVARVIEQVKDQFQFIFWRSLQNAPPLKTILKQCIQFLSDQQRTSLPEDLNSQILLLIEYLRVQRCLLVIDNIESILQSGDLQSSYREGYEDYSRFIQSLSEVKHQSCLILTGREKPGDVARLQTERFRFRLLQLWGIDRAASRKMLREAQLSGSLEEWNDFVQLYSGNPLALKIVSEPIQTLFGDSIARFLHANAPVFGNIFVLLEQQFNRLSELEEEVLFWLAVEREGISLEILHTNLVFSSLTGRLLETLEALQRKSLIEVIETACFILQPIILEYTTDRFVKRLYSEIETETPVLLKSHALIKAEAKDYVRASQEQFILKPLTKLLLTYSRREESEKRLGYVLSFLRNKDSFGVNYAAGNILNLLIQLKSDLAQFDFSYLTIQQAYLRGVDLSEVNFAYAHFISSIFTEAFGSIRSVAFNPERTVLAAGMTNGEIRLWQTTSGTPLLTCQGHKGWVNSIAFSTDGNLLASGGEDYTVRIWQTTTGRCLKTFSGHRGWVNTVTFSPGNHLVASGSDDGSIYLWDIDREAPPITLQGHQRRVYSLSFQFNGNVLASCGVDKTIRLWQVSTGDCINVLHGHASWIHTLAFSPVGNLLASAGHEQDIRLWDVSTGECLQILRGHSNWIASITFHPQGNMLASGGEDHTVRIWDIKTGKCIRLLSGHTNRVWSVAFSPDGVLVASGSDDQTVRLWDTLSGNCLKILQGYTSGVRSVAFEPEGHLLASGNINQNIHIWDVNEGRLIRSISGYTCRVSSISFSPNGKRIALGGDCQEIWVWEKSTGQSVYSLHGHNDWVRAVSFSPDGRIIASGSDDMTLNLWDALTGKCLKTLQGHSDWIRVVSFSPDGQIVASGSDDRSIRFWNVFTRQCVNIMQGHTSWIWDISFQANGNLLASSSNDQTIRLWDRSKGQCVDVWKNEPYQVLSVSFNPDGNLLVGGCDDNSIRIWNVSTGRIEKILQGHDQAVTSVRFNTDGSMLASGSQDRTIRLWDPQTELCIKTLRNDRPYERMNITGTRGLTFPQKLSLEALGAIDTSETDY